jgi:hypothetical protein
MFSKNAGTPFALVQRKYHRYYFVDVVIVQLTTESAWNASLKSHDWSKKAWASLVDLVGPDIDTPAMKQQWDCHVAGSWGQDGVSQNQSWDLELGRSSNPNWPLAAAGNVARAALGQTIVSESCQW